MPKSFALLSLVSSFAAKNPRSLNLRCYRICVKAPSNAEMVVPLVFARTCAHCGDDHDHEKQQIPIEQREELLKRWDQELNKLIFPQPSSAPPSIPQFPTAQGGPARFGPRAIRAASARQIPANSYNIRAGINQYLNWARILNCGNIPANTFDNALAKRQMHEAFLELATRDVPNPIRGISRGKHDLITLGGDRSITLPARCVPRPKSTENSSQFFTSMQHLDTGNPIWNSAFWTSDHSRFNHGSFFHTASREGLISNTSAAHASLRTRLTGLDDGGYSNPGPEQGFLRIHADDSDDSGAHGVIDTIISRIGLSPDEPVYSEILCGIEKLNLVGADIVGVSLSYDNVAEGTALAVTQVAFEIMSRMVKLGAKEDVG
ncbi:uncharacterized protein PADG_05368 [Paracoccidioides brasiliensis Pb18]|uniref:Agmatinase n=1 Tax=Paracoccidioides brasiliensis (strain Pb18) TaxID=502780 RepID=C1GDN2_PARBD|nr:uncharacterized protein PADG_05368 [Paracoccidioides brasiliensis Pb18]EEH49289.2 hypothetical protein PADG_05368 [Paracoccidioides brasiliensis Pb18]